MVACWRYIQGKRLELPEATVPSPTCHISQLQTMTKLTNPRPCRPSRFCSRTNVRSRYGNRELLPLSTCLLTCLEKETKKADTPLTKKEQKVERRSVSARVDNAVGKGVGIRAEKAPGEFTIPEGMTARNFKYRFHDPKSKIKLDKLSGSNIYSITEKRYVTEATSGPDFELPPGKYKFVVGGRPGAYGSLSFDVAPSDDVSVVIKDNVPVADLPQNGTLTAVIWNPEYPSAKVRWTFDIQRGVVTGNGVWLDPPDLENLQADYKFEGRLVDKCIKGTTSHTMSWVARNPNGESWVNTGKGDGPTEYKFRTDHTVIGSYTYTSVANGVEEPTTSGRWIGKWSMGTK